MDWLYWLFVEQSAWLASFVGIATMYFMGDKRWWAPWFGLAGQGLWVVLAVHVDQYGLLVATAFYGFMYLRAGLKWRQA
jgi:uncharacterized membrane protein